MYRRKQTFVYPLIQVPWAAQCKPRPNLPPKRPRQPAFPHPTLHHPLLIQKSTNPALPHPKDARFCCWQWRQFWTNLWTCSLAMMSSKVWKQICSWSLVSWPALPGVHWCHQRRWWLTGTSLLAVLFASVQSYQPSELCNWGIHTSSTGEVHLQSSDGTAAQVELDSEHPWTSWQEHSRWSSFRTSKPGMQVCPKWFGVQYYRQVCKASWTVHR